MIIINFQNHYLSKEIYVINNFDDALYQIALALNKYGGKAVTFDILRAIYVKRLRGYEIAKKHIMYKEILDIVSLIPGVKEALGIAKSLISLWKIISTKIQTRYTNSHRWLEKKFGKDYMKKYLCIIEQNEKKAFLWMAKALAYDINRAISKGKIPGIIILLDRYEILMERSEKQRALGGTILVHPGREFTEEDFWLEFLSFLDRAVIVIASREFPKNVMSRFKTSILQIDIMDPVHITNYLKKLGIDNDEIIREIYRRSKGYPLLVQALAREYLETKKIGSEISGNPIKELEFVYSRIIATIEPKMQKLLKVASIPIFFDKSLLSKALNEPITDFEFERLIRISAVRIYNEEKKYYAVHEIVRDIIIRSIDKESLKSFVFRISKILRNRYLKESDIDLLINRIHVLGEYSFKHAAIAMFDSLNILRFIGDYYGILRLLTSYFFPKDSELETFRYYYYARFLVDIGNMVLLSRVKKILRERGELGSILANLIEAYLSKYKGESKRAIIIFKDTLKQLENINLQNGHYFLYDILGEGYLILGRIFNEMFEIKKASKCFDTSVHYYKKLMSIIPKPFRKFIQLLIFEVKLRQARALIDGKKYLNAWNALKKTYNIMKKKEYEFRKLTYAQLLKGLNLGLMARVAYRKGDKDLSLKLVKKSMKTFQKVFKVIKLALEKDEYKKILGVNAELADFAANLIRTQAKILFMFGGMYIESLKLLEIANAFSKYALKLSSGFDIMIKNSDGLIQAIRAWCYNNICEYKKAEEYANEAIKTFLELINIERDLVPPYSNLALAYSHLAFSKLGLGKYSEALKATEDAIKYGLKALELSSGKSYYAMKDVGFSFVLRGILNLILGDNEKAEDSFTVAERYLSDCIIHYMDCNIYYLYLQYWWGLLKILMKDLTGNERKNEKRTRIIKQNEKKKPELIRARTTRKNNINDNKSHHRYKNRWRRQLDNPRNKSKERDNRCGY